MIKIAITGNIGSGKSTITKIIRELGFKVFDSDKEVKKALIKKDLINQICKEFKSKIDSDKFSSESGRLLPLRKEI